MEGNAEEILYTIAKKNMNTYDHNLQEFWDTIKRPNLRIHSVGKAAEMQTKGMGNLLNEILVGNFPNLCNDIDNNLQEAF
jgi:hypothetical protein